MARGVPGLSKKSIRLWAFVFFLLASVATLAHSSKSPPASQTLPPPHIDIEELIIAHNLNHPPYKFVDKTGQAAGLIVDLWRIWSEKTGLPVRFVSAPFAETVEMVKDGRAHLNAGLFHTHEREAFMDFTNPIHGVAYYIIFHKSILGVDGPEDLEGFRVGVPAGGFTEHYVRKNHPGLALAPYDDYPSLFEAAGRGEVKVFLAPLENLREYLREKNLDNDYRHRQGRPLFVRQYLGGMKKGNPQLVDWANEGLQRISLEERAALEQKWLGWTSIHPGKDTLLITISTGYRPFSFQDPSGKPAGMLVDFWKLWGETTGTEVAFYQGAWSDSIRAVKNGEADFHSGLFSSPSRREWMVFSVPIYELETSLYHLPEKEYAPDLQILEDIRLGVTKGSYQEEYATNSLPHSSKVIAYYDTEEMLYALIEGHIDAFIDETIVVDHLLTKDRFAGQVVSHSAPLFSRYIRAGLPGTSQDLLERINTGIVSISRDQLQELERRWIMDSRSRYYERKTSMIPSQSVYLTPEEQAWLDEHPVIRLGVDPGFEPFEFLTENGDYAGVASDYVDLLNQRLGANLKVIPYNTWGTVVEKAKARQIDVLPAVMETAARKDYLVFTRPYLTSPEMIFCRKGAPFVGGVEDLRGKSIALKRFSYMEDRIRRDYPELKLDLYETTYEALEAVSSGKAHAYINTLAHGSYVIAKHNLSNIKVAAPMGGRVDGITFAIRKDWPILKGILEKGLASISPEEAAEIRSRWITVRFEHGHQVKTILKWAGIVLGVVLIIMALGFVWNRRLAREIAHREQVEERLKAAKEHAESADRLKSAFLATMSHELRTPLNSIIGFSSIVLQELPGPLNDEQKKQLGMVRNSARHLLALINDVLDISKIEADQLVLAPEDFDLAQSVQDVVHSVRPMAEKKGLSLDLEMELDSLPMFCDQRRIEQVIINLVNNAIKFTESGKVNVVVKGPSSLNPQGEEMLLIQVEDTGIGIKPQDFSKLFKPFRQIETGLDRKYEGTGLGLSICKKLVKLMGGKITVESEFNHGSRFSVRLPVQCPECVED